MAFESRSRPFFFKKKKKSVIYTPHCSGSLTSEVSHFIYFLIGLIYVFILAARWASFAAHGLSSCSERASGCSCREWALGTRLQEVWPRGPGVSATGSRAQSPWLWPMGLAAPWHVASPWTSDGTRISCIDRWILYHWTTREALILHFKRSH